MNLNLICKRLCLEISCTHTTNNTLHLLDTGWPKAIFNFIP